MKCKFHSLVPGRKLAVISKRFIDYAYNDKRKYINEFIIEINSQLKPLPHQVTEISERKKSDFKALGLTLRRP